MITVEITLKDAVLRMTEREREREREIHEIVHFQPKSGVFSCWLPSSGAAASRLLPAAVLAPDSFRLVLLTRA